VKEEIKGKKISIHHHVKIRNFNSQHTKEWPFRSICFILLLA